MYGRLTRIKGSAEGLEESIRTFEEGVVSKARGEPGFVGVALLVNRETSEGVAIAYWKDRDSLEASADRAKQIRATAASASGETIADVESGEIVSMERSADPAPGTFARLNSIDANPDQIDAAIATYRAEVVPLLKSLPGFRSVVMSVNRESGRTMVGSVWATESDRANSEAKLAELRKKATAAAGAPRATVELFEVVYADIRAGAPAGS